MPDTTDTESEWSVQGPRDNNRRQERRASNRPEKTSSRDSSVDRGPANPKPPKHSRNESESQVPPSGQGNINASGKNNFPPCRNCGELGHGPNDIVSCPKFPCVENSRKHGNNAKVCASIMMTNWMGMCNNGKMNDPTCVFHCKAELARYKARFPSAALPEGYLCAKAASQNEADDGTTAVSMILPETLSQPPAMPPPGVATRFAAVDANGFPQLPGVGANLSTNAINNTQPRIPFDLPAYHASEPVQLPDRPARINPAVLRAYGVSEANIERMLNEEVEEKKKAEKELKEREVKILLDVVLEGNLLEPFVSTIADAVCARMQDNLAATVTASNNKLGEQIIELKQQLLISHTREFDAATALQNATNCISSQLSEVLQDLKKICGEDLPAELERLTAAQQQLATASSMLDVGLAKLKVTENGFSESEKDDEEEEEEVDMEEEIATLKSTYLKMGESELKQLWVSTFPNSKKAAPKKAATMATQIATIQIKNVTPTKSGKKTSNTPRTVA